VKNIFSKNKKRNKEPYNELILEISSIRDKSSTIAFAPDNTGYSWLGIKNGAIALFPDTIVCLPQNYSNSIFIEKELIELSKKIASLKFNKIIFRGFPFYFEKLIRNIRLENQECEIFVLYGGFYSEFSYNDYALKGYNKIITLARERIIDKIGFNKNGLAETTQKLFKVECQQYFNKTIAPLKSSKKNQLDIINIGVLANHDFRKNIHNQVAGALLIDHSNVYVGKKDKFDYFENHMHRIKNTPDLLPHNEFIQVIHNMTINMYVSFSESWGHVILESLAGGIPCLASNTSSIFDSNEVLANALIVDKFDDSFAIYKKAKSILDNYEEISAESIKHVQHINKLADDKMDNFLNIDSN
tara:strand:- start:7991 stop:9064 length:1074 start_codon:yes stop_codon:yes gene_type:complete